MIVCEFETGKKTHLRHISVGAIVVQDNKILLIKRSPQLSEGGKYGLPGGYLDVDETASQGIIREVYEETGYEITIQQLYIINTYPHRRNEEKQNVDLIFLGTPLRQTGTPDWEQTDVRWFSLDKLPKTIAFDHELYIKQYISYINNPLALPLIDIH